MSPCSRHHIAFAAIALAGAGCDTPNGPPAGVSFAASVTVAAGDAQTGAQGTELPFALAVIVLDSAGQPLPAVKVLFVVTSGGGSAAPESALTNFDGRAETVWTLGAATGNQTIEARVTREGRPTLAAEFDAVSVQLARPAGIVVQTRAMGDRPYSVAISPLGLAYVTRLDSAAVHAADPASLQLGNPVGVGNVPTDVTFSLNGATAYVTNQFDAALGVINTTTGVQTATIPMGGDPFDVIVSPDGGKVYVSTNAGRVMILNASTNAVIDTTPTGGAPMRMVFHPDGTRLYAANVLMGMVHEISHANGSILRTFVVGGTPQGMAVSPNGVDLFIANQAGRVDVWNLVTNVQQAPITLPFGGFFLAMTKDATQLYVGYLGTGAVAVIDRQTRTIVNTVVTGGSPRRIAFSPDGLTALIANQDGWVDFVR